MNPRLAIHVGTPVLLRGEEKRRYFSYGDVESLVLWYRRDIEEQGYRFVVALHRGGNYPASMISQTSDIELAYLRYDRATGMVRSDDALHHTARSSGGGKLLLVEDVAGKGHTLQSAKIHLERLGWEVDVFCIVSDDMSRIRPKFGVHLSGGVRYIFPWERTILDPTAVDRTTEYPLGYKWRCAWDLDGVFAPDLPESNYTDDLEATLKVRDSLSALQRPAHWRDGDLIVSGRLEADRARTMDWLRVQAIHPSELLLRNDTKSDPARHKIQMLQERAVVEYFESDHLQARTIAEALPHCVVWWYSDGAVTRVGANQS